MKATDDVMLEKFYVYRSLSIDESWGAIILGDNLCDKLPNIDFGMKVFANNETEAIARAKREYDKIHAQDSNKENIRRFAAAALKGYIVAGKYDADELAMTIAIRMNKRYSEYFDRLARVKERKGEE